MSNSGKAACEEPDQIGNQARSEQYFSDLDLAKIWRTILRPDAAEDGQFINKYYKWRRPLSVEGLLRQPRIWMSWSYKAAYPKLAKFLEKASLDSKFRCQVILEEFETNDDRYQRRMFRYNEAHAPLSAIFDTLKTLPTQAEKAESFASQVHGTKLMTRHARILHIMDISPLILSCIFGTSSSLDISHIAAFVERNLNGLNWAKVNLLQIRPIGWSSFIYEYHFSFYYVTLDYFDADTIKPDPRKARRSCPFGQRKNAKHRYIHEETLSFLLCGHFDDAFSCYQLVDTYFRPRYAKSTGPRAFRSYDPKQSPGQLFLYWIAVALFHARSRWENAIDALDSAVKSPADVVFMEDRNDLMADDPQFSLSKTYFWALQTYKLFERTLQQTIATWENFKNDSLPKVLDGRISREDWDAGVGSIDQAINHLKLKIARVQRGIQDVKDLREGLQSTAAVFDSRTAVRQGDNIRLLTYITLLFLPLTFGTGIFGMQIIEPGPKTIKAFAITLPSITIVTVLLVFNLNTIMTACDSLVRRITSGLQGQMKRHYRKDWKDRALALHEDNLTAEPPARKAAKQSSHWAYLLFLIEAIVVTLPVSELDAAIHYYRLLHSDDDSYRDDDSSKRSDIGTEPRGKRLKEIQSKVQRAIRQAQEQERRRRDEERGAFRTFLSRLCPSSLRVASVLLQIVFSFFRILLLPMWVIIIVIDYALVSISLLLMNGLSPRAMPKVHEPMSPSAREYPQSPFSRAWRTLGLDTVTFPVQRYSTYPVRSSDETTLENAQQHRSRSKEQSWTENPVIRQQTKHSTLQELPTTEPRTFSPVSLNQERMESFYTSGAQELTTFTAQPRSDTVNRMWRAANYAAHGGGFIPGDIARTEL